MAEPDQSADELFEHLQELMDRLPAMQRTQAKLERARAAERVMSCDREHRDCATMLAMADEELAKAQAALEAALGGEPEPEPGDAKVERAARAKGTTSTKEAAQAGDGHLDLLRRAVLYRSSQRGFRVGPEKNTRVALERALEAGGFADVDEARKATMTTEEQDALAQNIAAYQQDYDETLKRCQALEEQTAPED